MHVEYDLFDINYKPCNVEQVLSDGKIPAICQNCTNIAIQREHVCTLYTSIIEHNHHASPKITRTCVCVV